MKIGLTKIGGSARPYLIAEMSGNHNQSLDRALALVDAAADSGADAIKLQTYTADTMTLDVSMPGFVITDPKSLAGGFTSCTKKHTRLGNGIYQSWTAPGQTISIVSALLLIAQRLNFWKP